MGIIERLFKRQTKQNPAWGAILRYLGSRDAVWTTKRYDKLSEAGYQNCMTLFACVNQVTKSCRSVEWLLQKRRGKNRDEVEEHSLLELLYHPNPGESKEQFIEGVVAYLLLAGNSYVIKNSIGSTPRELYTLRPDRVRALPGSGKELIRGYRYELGGEKQDYERGEVLHLKEFHPTDDFYGLSRIEVAARAVDISNKSMEWNKKLLDNDMRPAGALSYEDRVTDEQINQIRRQFREEVQGYENAGEFVVTSGGAKWLQMSMTAKDMDWLNSDKVTARRICSVFGVAPELIGDSENKTYSNYQEARRALYMETVLPLMSFICSGLNLWLTPLFGEDLILDFDRDAIDALQEESAKKYAYITQANWLTVDEKREATGYDALGAEKGGDLVLVPMGMTRLDKMTEEAEPEPEFEPEPEPGIEPEEEPGAEAEPEAEAEPKPKPKPEPKPEPPAKSAKSASKSFWSAQERKEALWRNFESRIKAKEKGLLDEVKPYLNRQAETLRRRILGHDSIGSINAPNIFDVRAETKAFVKAFYPRYEWLFKHAGEAGIRATKGELYAFDETKDGEGDFDMTEALRTSLRKMVMAAGKVINEDTLKSLVDMIETADFEEIAVKELAQRIYDTGLFGQDRAIRIARTETGKVENGGMVEGYRQNEYVDKKGWLCAFVEDSREEHKAADGQEVALDADFTVGGESLAYPGDPKGKPGNIVNCLCATYPVVSE